LALTILPLLATLLADPFELNAGITTEARAGQSPVLASQDSQAFMAMVATPRLEAALRDRQTDVRLSYFPRFVWQSPNTLGRTVRPLLLNQAALSLSSRPTATSELGAHAFGSYGEPDYTILPQLIGAGQGMVPVGSGQAQVPQVQKILTFSVGVLGETAVTRRWALSLGLDASHFRPIAAPSDPNLPPPAGMFVGLIKQTAVTASPGVIHRLTAHDDLALIVGATYATYSTGIELGLVSTTLSWRARRAGSDEYRLDLGVTGARDLGEVSALPSGRDVSPTGRVEALVHLVGEDEYGLFVRLRAAVDEFVDPILAQVYPRGLVAGQLTLVQAPDWSFGVQGDFVTSLRTSAAPSGFDETAFSLVMHIRHRVNDNLIVEVGGRWSERAPALAASNFGFHAQQLWGYVSLTADTRERPRWTGR